MKIRIIKPDAMEVLACPISNTWIAAYCKVDTIEFDIDEMVYKWIEEVGRFKQAFSEYLQEKMK